MKSLKQQILDAKDIDNLLIQDLSQVSTIRKVLGFDLIQVEKNIREENDTPSNRFSNSKKDYRQR